MYLNKYMYFLKGELLSYECETLRTMSAYLAGVQKTLALFISISLISSP